MKQIDRFEIIASADSYWTQGVEQIRAGEQTFDETVRNYARELVRGFLDKKYSLENIRKVVQCASRLDGESSRFVNEHGLAGLAVGSEDLLEIQARRLAHHSLRQTRNIVSSANSVWMYCRENQISR